MDEVTVAFSTVFSPMMLPPISIVILVLSMKDKILTFLKSVPDLH